jgi:hypothetical protein
MANVKISTMTALSSVADSTILPVVDSGTNYKITASQIKTYIGATTYANSNVAGYLPTFTGNIQSGNASVTANISGGNLSISGISTVTGTITGGNLTSNAEIAGYGALTLGNIANATATKTRIVTAGTISYIQTGNGTAGSTGNIVFSPTLDATARVTIDTSSGNLNATGNITGANLIAGTSGTGNVYASNIIVNGQPTTYGYVNPGYVNVGLTNTINGLGSGSTLIYDATLKNNGTAVTYNTGTGVFTLTAGVTYNLMATGSWFNFSDTTNGYIVYAWVDATTGTRLDTTGNSDGIAEPLNRPVNEFNATAAELIYTPVTNQTVKVNVVAAGGTVAMRGGIGSKAIVTQINPTIAVQATATGTVSKNYAKYVRTTAQTVSAGTVVICSTLESSSGTAVSVNTSTGQVTLTAGTYRLRGTIGSFNGSAAAALIGYSWYNETTSAYIGEGAGLNGSTSTAWNATMGGTAEAVITVASTTVVSFRVVSVTGTSSIGGNTAADFGAPPYAYPWIDIEQMGATFALNALDTISTTGNVSVGGNLTVTGNIAGTAVKITAPTFQAVTPSWGLGDVASAAWFLLGTWNTSQAGNCLYMRLLGHCGYNGVATQNQVTELMFATSNDSSYITGSSGNYYAAGSASVNSRLGTGGTSPNYQAPNKFRIIQVSKTQYQIYAYFSSAYMRNSNYSIQITPGDTWTDGGGNGGVTAPTGNYVEITPSSF